MAAPFLVQRFQSLGNSPLAKVLSGNTPVKPEKKIGQKQKSEELIKFRPVHKFRYGIDEFETLI